MNRMARMDGGAERLVEAINAYGDACRDPAETKATENMRLREVRELLNALSSPVGRAPDPTHRWVNRGDVAEWGPTVCSRCETDIDSEEARFPCPGERAEEGNDDLSILESLWSCPVCPTVVRNLHAVAHNLLTAWDDPHRQHKVPERRADLRRAVEALRPLRDAHFADEEHSHSARLADARDNPLEFYFGAAPERMSERERRFRRLLAQHLRTAPSPRATPAVPEGERLRELEQAAYTALEEAWDLEDSTLPRDWLRQRARWLVDELLGLTTPTGTAAEPEGPCPFCGLHGQLCQCVVGTAEPRAVEGEELWALARRLRRYSEQDFAGKPTMLSPTLDDAADVLERLAAPRPESEPRELLCMICKREHPVWSAYSPLWNATVRDDGRDEWPFLCPTCFVNKAVERGVATSFFVTAGPLPPWPGPEGGPATFVPDSGPGGREGP